MSTLDEKLNKMALEFCLGMLGHVISEERLKTHYAPIVKQLLDKAIKAAKNNPAPKRG